MGVCLWKQPAFELALRAPRILCVVAAATAAPIEQPRRRIAEKATTLSCDFHARDWKASHTSFIFVASLLFRKLVGSKTTLSESTNGKIDFKQPSKVDQRHAAKLGKAAFRTMPAKPT